MLFSLTQAGRNYEKTTFEKEDLFAGVWALVFLGVIVSQIIVGLMPALRSAWFGIHIGSAVFSYASFMAWYLIIAVPVVFFTFAGVNTLLPGLHSYG